MQRDRSGARQRAEAARAVDAVVSRGESLDAALADAAGRIGDAGLPMVKFLAYGVLRNHWRLAWFEEQLLDRPLRSRDSIVGALIRVGLFQLSDSRVPVHAAVSETVDAARILRQPRYAGLINAVLRNFGRRELRDKAPAAETARFNHPAWLIELIRTDWPDHWEDVLAANQRQAPMWLRVNPRTGDGAAWLARSGLAGAVQAGMPQAVRLDEPVPVAALPGFAEGEVSVQDAAAQIAPPWLLADGGGRILDACAAPGGKTGQLLELAGKGAALLAIDASAGRIDAIRQNLERLELSATVRVADASNPGEWWDGEPFDRVLVDAPCSGTGVIRRHPDIALLRRADDIAALAARQRDMLAALWPLVAPGGRLLYVTCSVLAAENDGVVEPFLAAHDDAVESRVLHDYNIRALMCDKRVGFQVLPGTADMDGFYFACLDKRQA